MTKALKQIGESLTQAWQSVSEGWRELVDRSSAALTRFIPHKYRARQGSASVPVFPQWGLLAGEVIDKDRTIVVQVELPGIAREDCDISIHGRKLRIRGEKRAAREHIGDSYYVMERAYGSFERVIPLPDDVEPDSAHATLRHGVLKLELKKKPSSKRKLITVK